MLNLIFIVGWVVVFGAIAVRNRMIALAVLVAALPLYVVRFSLGPAPSTLLEGMILTLFLAWVIEKRGIGRALRCIQEKVSQASRVEKVHYFFLYLFFLSATVSVAVSSDSRAALGVWRAYFIEPALFFIVFLDTVTTREQLLRIIGASIFSGTLIALLAVYQKLTGWNIPAPWVDERRVTSIYPYPNAVGLYLAPIVWLTLGRAGELLRRIKTRKAIGVSLSALLMIVALLFSKTEAALVALTITAVGIGLLWSARTRVITTLIIFCGALIFFSSPAISRPITEKLLLRDWSGSVRIKTWKETAAMLADHPVTGAGLAGYQRTFEPYHTREYIEIFLYPHTIIFNFWSETGIYGLMSFLLACITVGILLYRVARHKNERLFAYIFGAALVTILIHGLVDVPYFKNDLAVQFWFLSASAVVLYRLSRTGSNA